MKNLTRLLVLALAVLVAPAFAQKVRLATSAGDIVVELNAEKAPMSVENFLKYVRAGHYDGVIFHRVIDGFMIQTGGYRADLSERPTRPPITLEAGNGLSNVRGSIAMARTSDPNSATAQFFINVKDNAFLNPSAQAPGYTVFGKVISGMDVVEKIRLTPTGPGGPFPTDVPKTPILINSATLVN